MKVITPLMKLLKHGRRKSTILAIAMTQVPEEETTSPMRNFLMNLRRSNHPCLMVS